MTLIDFISQAPTPFHAVDTVVRELQNNGYLPLEESSCSWDLLPGYGYYITRNRSSVIAFRIPSGRPQSFMITASHDDSPCFKIKENAEVTDAHYTRLSVEKYGGMLCAPWLDRPLSVAGRVTVRTGDGLATRLIDFRNPCVLIPNVAIHMNREANNGMKYNLAVDMIPLFGTHEKRGQFEESVARLAGVGKEDVLSADLFTYVAEPGVEWGEFVSAPRLDDLQCAYSALTAFIDSGRKNNPPDTIPVYCLFDNEEVGSETKQGAASTFLYDSLTRLSSALRLTGSEYRSLLASSLMLSCDNGHAVHPNHPEYQDPNHAVYMNQGVVIKYNAQQKYTSDAVSASLFKLICQQAGVPYQMYCNRADIAGGSTLGNISNTQVSLNTVDIGLAQLAMHSAYETAGVRDTGYMIQALTCFYSRQVRMNHDGDYSLV